MTSNNGEKRQKLDLRVSFNLKFRFGSTLKSFLYRLKTDLPLKIKYLFKTDF